MSDAQYQVNVPAVRDGDFAALRINSQRELITTTDGSAGTGSGFSSAATFNRTADTNAYLANDIVGAATGATAALTFANVGPSGGGEVFITTVKFEIDIAAVPSGMAGFMLSFYSVTPPSALGDNAPFDIPSGDRASFLQTVSLNTPIDYGATLAVITASINQQITVPSGGSLFAYLVTVGAYTPAASSPFKITVKTVAI